MIRLLFGNGLSLALLSALLALWLATLVVQEQPLVRQATQFSSADAARAKRLIRNKFPGQAESDAHDRRRLDLTQPDLQLLANYLLSLYGQGSALVTLSHDSLLLQSTFALPGDGRYLNLQLGWGPNAADDGAAQLSIGELQLPSWLTDLLLELLPQLIDNELPAIADTIADYRIDAGRLSLVYSWQPERWVQDGRRLLLAIDEDALRFYHARLATLTRRNDPAQRLPLTGLLETLFRQAGDRARQYDPAQDHRALLLVVGAYVNGHSIKSLLGDGGNNLAVLTPRRVVLQGRQDLAQHFAGSAAVAAIGNRELANSAGLFKEIEDSRRGSGFSFRDLAADLAGARFGELTTSSAAAAQQLQKRIAAGISDPDLMPDTRDLPEYLSAKQFEDRFGGLAGIGYKSLRATIEQRIAACALYRGL